MTGDINAVFHVTGGSGIFCTGQTKSVDFHSGELAQMVERSLSMWEVGGSIPPVSNKTFLAFSTFKLGEERVWDKN